MREFLGNYTCSHVHPHPLTLEWERSYPTEDMLLWIRHKRYLPVLCVFAYIAFLKYGTQFMKNRRKYELKTALTLWNGALALFSIVGTIRCLPEVLDAVLHYPGLHHSICDFPIDRISMMWGVLFALSKIPELGDTVFIVLRKQPLIFLHWYHHIVTLLYTWFAISEVQAPGRWFTTINFLIHSFMYTYFALKSMGYHPYKFIQMSITVLQLTQMVLGCYINYFVYRWWLQDEKDRLPCQVSLAYTNVASIMYFSYLLLFGNFFYQSYMAKPKQSKKIR